MKKIIYYITPITALLITFIIVNSLISHYNNVDKNIPEIPSYKTYNDAVKNELPKIITEKASNHSCSGYILPLQDTEANAPVGFVEDINIALSNYPDWKLLVTTEEKEKMMDRWEETIDTWGSMLSGRNIEQYLRTQSEVAINTNYSVDAKYTEGQYANNATQRIIVNINNDKTRTRLFNATVTYTDENTIIGWKNRRKAKINHITKLKNRAETARITLISFSVIVGLYYLILLGIFTNRRIGKANVKKSYLQQIDKREDLVNEGHYRAALDLADNYLQFFPNDTDIKAFRDRLLVFTGGDPKKAEEAYIEALKLRSYLEKDETDTFKRVQPDELEKSANLIPYNPHLKDVHNKLVKIEQNKKKEEEAEISNKIQLVYSLIKKGGIVQAREILYEIKKRDSNNPDIIQLDDMLMRRSGNFSLISKNQERIIYFLVKNTVIFGREDEENSPDIPFKTNRISREHMRLYRKGNKLEVEDLNSANGTFVNGNKIDAKTALKNDDTLNLAKIIDLYVTVKEEENKNYYILYNNRKAVCIYTNTAFFTIDNTDYRVSFIDGVTLLQNENTQVVIPGESIMLGDETYQVEVL